MPAGLLPLVRNYGDTPLPEKKTTTRAVAMDMTTTGMVFDQPIYVVWCGTNSGGRMSYWFGNYDQAMLVISQGGKLVGTSGFLSATESGANTVELQRVYKQTNRINQYAITQAPTVPSGWQVDTTSGANGIGYAYTESGGGAGFVPLYSVEMGNGYWYITESTLEAAYHREHAVLFVIANVEPSTLDLKITRGPGGTVTSDHAGQAAVLNFGGSLVIGVDPAAWPESQLSEVRFYTTQPGPRSTPAATYTVGTTSDPQVETLTIGSATICVSRTSNQTVRLTDDEVAPSSGGDSLWYEVDFVDGNGTTHTLDPELTNKTGSKQGGSSWE